MDRRTEKDKIRKLILAKRVKKSAAWRAEADRIIWGKLRRIRDFKEAKTVMFYVSKGSEVDTHNMIRRTLKTEKKVCVPRISKKRRSMFCVFIKSFEEDLAPGTFGISEPHKGRKRMLPPQKIDLVLVPGIAFGENGQRIGWGMGYYDKFLKGMGEAVKIALAFDFQVLPEIPECGYDIPVDKVVTEKSIYKRQQKYGGFLCKI